MTDPSNDSPNNADFGLPWCQALLSTPGVRHVPMDSRRHGGVTGPHENSFFAKTLSTPTTLKACVALLKPGDGQYPEINVLMSIGPDLNGHNAFMGGSVACAFFDEALGLAAQQAFPRSDTEVFFTGEITVRFLKPVPAPGVLVVKSSVIQVEGRKCITQGTIEDGHGNVFSKAKGTFIQVKNTKL